MFEPSEGGSRLRRPGWCGGLIAVGFFATAIAAETPPRGGAVAPTLGTDLPTPVTVSWETTAWRATASGEVPEATESPSDREILESAAGAIGVCAPAACPTPWWAHRDRVFGEFLLLRPGSSDLIYAVEQTDPDPSVASPTGPLGIVAVDPSPGFRVGFSKAASHCSSLEVAFARWDGSASSTLNASGGNVLASNLFHPSTETSGAASLSSAARQRLRFHTVDVLYRHLWRASDTTALNWIAGLRYGNLDQSLRADQTVQVATGLTSLDSRIEFDGFGISGGLDWERFSPRSGLSIYGRGMAHLLAGEWDASYTQRNQFGGGVIANRYEDFRLTPVLEAEIGLAWSPVPDRCRLHAGMMVSGWYDAVTTRSYIEGVRSGRLTGVGETLTFSGLTLGMDLRF